jgi:hypothetical protein
LGAILGGGKKRKQTMSGFAANNKLKTPGVSVV